VLNPKIDGLLNARTRVVQKEQKRSVAQGMAAVPRQSV
jgi:hypothetical protein